MPNYAPFGNAIFGETLFGVPPIVSVYTTISITPIGYSALEVNWTPIKGSLGQVLVRSAYGTPTSITDGTVLLSESNLGAYSAQYVDSNLQAGRFYYYALFVLVLEQATPQIEEYLLAAYAQGLVLTDWNFSGTFQSWMPDWYLWADGNLATQAQPEGPLVRFLNLIGYEMDWIRSEIETLSTISSADFISGALLPDLGSTYGVTYEPELGMTRSRVLVKNAVALYKQKGTAEGIAAAASAFSGYGAEVTIGKNLEIQLDDSAFDMSTGHWVAANSATSLKLVSASTYSLTLPHIAYLPIQGNPTALALNTALGVQGYLPDNNNENVLGFSGVSSSFLWTQVFPATIPVFNEYSVMAASPTEVLLFIGYNFNTGYSNPQTWFYNGTNWSLLSPATSPPGRVTAGLAYDTATSTWVLFGGSNSGDLDDTWTFNGTTWTQKAPGTTPPGGPIGGMVYDTSSSTVVLFGPGGGNTNQTWSWNGTNWSQLTPSTSPFGRFNFSMAYDSSNSTIVLFGGYTVSHGVFTFLNDTWIWNGSNWSEVFPATSPSPRFSPYMSTYSGGVLLFGGCFGRTHGTFVPFNDTWIWNGVNWVEFSYLVNPADGILNPQFTPCMCYLSSISSVILANEADNTFWTWAVGSSVPAQITTCTTANAKNLGIPVTAGTNVTLSAYFLPAPAATITLRSFEMQLDWYGATGNLISSSVGPPFAEINGTWVRTYMTGVAPSGTFSMGRTVKSTTPLSGDLHLMDAEMIEIGSNLNSWKPPRDIKVNLFPLRQNLIVNGQGLAGTFGWTNPEGGTMTAVSSGPSSWPQGTTSGFRLQATGSLPWFVSAQQMPLEVIGGGVYTASLFLQPVAGTGTFEFEIQWFAAGNIFISSPSVEITPTAGQWTQFLLSNIIAPDNAIYANMVTVADGSIGDPVFYMGAPLFGPGSLAQYFDGTFSPTSDYFFEGTPNESVSDYYPELEVKLSRLVNAMPQYTPIGSTFSLVTGAQAFSNIGETL